MNESIKNLANQIVKSWKDGQENYIIIAPPMSSSENLFRLIQDDCFLETQLGEFASRLAIAKLSRSNFSSEEKFVSALAKQWNTCLNSDLDPIDQLNYLTNEKIKNKKIPILLIERFHEAMERLGEDFGTALRDLDKALSLRTVVEFPVSKKMLKMRWEADTKKAPFLNSDWGQGHTEKILQGYSRQEVINLVLERGETSEKADFLFTATGGLPELVNHLIVKIEKLPLTSYEQWVRGQANTLCDRLLKWLDNPGNLTYTRLTAQSLSFSDPHYGPTNLKNHPWVKIIQGPDGKTNCKILAWACLNLLSIEYDGKYLHALINAINIGQAEYASAQLEILASKNNSNWEVWRALELLCRLHNAIDPYSLERWKIAEKHWLDIQKLAQQTTSLEVKSIVQKLEKLNSITQLICEFIKQKKVGGIERLEQFVCTKPDVLKTGAFLDLLELRQKRAIQLKPALALKAVIEQPESLFQVYCQLKLEICFWNYSGMNEADVSQINNLLKKPYAPPNKGQNLSFFHMLCLSLIKCDTFSQQDGLLLNDTEFQEFTKIYEDRNRQVHSTAFVSNSEWNEYLTYCQKLLQRSKFILVGSNVQTNISEPIDCFLQLAQSLAPNIKSNFSSNYYKE